VEERQLVCATGDEDRWPIFVIPDWDREHIARPKTVDLAREIASTRFDFGECP